MTTAPLPLKWWRPLGHADRVAIALIVALPLVLFGVPALFGHPAIAADNLIQNYPLRVLTGEQFRSGHLPLLNPLANSSTPLLGGMNAGSFFPATFLFVVLPSLLAWTLNLVLVYVTAALGMFALLRWHRLSTLSSVVAALVFAYGGSMMGQMVHLGVIQGFALLPFATLALLALARSLCTLRPDASWRATVRAMVPGTLSFAVLWALECLSGEPRAIAEIELLTMIIVPCVVLVHSSYRPAHWRQRGAFVVGAAVGVGWGVVIGLAQLLPGLNFIAQSQRASTSYSFFGAGSLYLRWTAIFLDQTILGSNGFAGTPNFFTGYNLPEVTGYVGVLALVAVAGFLSRLTPRGWRGEERDYVLYGVVMVVGLLASWGSTTPLGHVFQRVPLFGSTRLQSRNVVLVDLGAAALLGWWLHRVESRDLEGAGLGRRRRLITLAPALATVALSLAMMARGPAIVRWMGASDLASQMANHETLTLLLQLGIAGSLCAVVLLGRRLVRPERWLVVITAIDVIVFILFSSTGLVSGNVNPMPSRAHALHQLGGTGRFALIDPARQHFNEFVNVGAPNLNVFTKVPSVQGYGSLVNSLYGNVTYTHPLFSLDSCRLVRGTFKSLRLAAVVIAADVLATPVTSPTPHPIWCPGLSSVTNAQRYFGRLLAVADVTLESSNGTTVSRGPVTAQLLDPRGHPFGPIIVELGSPRVTFHFGPDRMHATGVQFNAPAGALLFSTTVTQPSGGTPYRLNGGFQQALSTSSWHVGPTTGTLTIFRAVHVLPTAWLSRSSRHSRVTSIRNASWGDSWITVRTSHPTVLRRSDEWLPGWRATAFNVKTGRSETLTVERSGLIQRVRVPAGTWQVHFHYHAPYIELGIASSALGSMALLASLALSRGWWRRRTNGRVLG